MAELNDVPRTNGIFPPLIVLANWTAPLLNKMVIFPEKLNNEIIKV